MSKIFDYEKLEAFPIAIELVALIDETVHLMPRGGGDIADKLQALVKSIPRDIAVATCAETEEEKFKLFRQARNTAIECSSLLDICTRLEMVDQDHMAVNRDLIERVANMINKLMKT